MSMFSKRPMNVAQSAAILKLWSELNMSEARADNLLASGFLADLAHPDANFINRDGFRKSISLNATIEGTYRFTVNWDISNAEVCKENQELTRRLDEPSFRDPAWAEGEVEYEYLIRQTEEYVAPHKLKAYGRGLDLGRPWKPATFRHAHALVTQGWKAVSTDVQKDYYHAVGFQLLFPGTTLKGDGLSESDIVQLSLEHANGPPKIEWVPRSRIEFSQKSWYAEHKARAFFLVFVRPVYRP